MYPFELSFVNTSIDIEHAGIIYWEIAAYILLNGPDTETAGGVYTPVVGSKVLSLNIFMNGAAGTGPAAL